MREPLSLDLHLHHRTEKAVLVSADGNRNGAVWLPLVAIEIEGDAAIGAVITATIPEKLAHEKGLI